MVDRFQGLRCRPGDLAVIVQDEPECQAVAADRKLTI